MKWLMIIMSMVMIKGAVADSERHKTDLKTIMNDLMVQTQSLSKSILLKDFKSMQQAASKVANHAKPAKQTLLTIKATLNDQMLKFKQYDQIVHLAAEKIKVHAAAKDIESATAEYLKMYQGCQSCHLAFKQKVSQSLAIEQH